MSQPTEEKTATASETKRNVLRHWPKDVSSPVIPARFERATHSLEGCCSNPTELRNRSDTAKLAQLFRICNTSDRVSATDRGTSIRRPVLLPYPLSNCARPHNEKAPQRPSSASSDRPSSQRRVVRITRRKAARRSDEKRSFGPNSAKRKKNRSYRIAPDRAHTDSAKRTNGIPTRRPDGTGPIRDTPCKIRSCYRIRPFR